ncbi:MAG: hypothetical protein ACYTXY_11800, partial [Nostoc sp.]
RREVPCVFSPRCGNYVRFKPRWFLSLRRTTSWKQATRSVSQRRTETGATYRGRGLKPFDLR